MTIPMMVYGLEYLRLSMGHKEIFEKFSELLRLRYRSMRKLRAERIKAGDYLLAADAAISCRELEWAGEALRELEDGK